MQVYGVFLFTTQFTLPMLVTTAAYSLIISKLATRGGVTRSQGAGAGRNTVRGRYIYNIYTIYTIYRCGGEPSEPGTGGAAGCCWRCWRGSWCAGCRSTSSTLPRTSHTTYTAGGGT